VVLANIKHKNLYYSMKNSTNEGQAIRNADFSKKSPPDTEYDSTTFSNCNFSDSDLSGIKFIECNFINCNLSMAKLINTVLTNVRFRSCKMLGLQFENCNEYGLSVEFEDCNLSHTSFYRTRLKKMIFRNLILNDTDFTEADLSSSVFEKCDLTGALFENSVLEKTDFCTSFNYSIDPEKNRIKRARFSLSGISGLLDKYDIEIDTVN
jgi:fluoroquinolone resistance protein